MSDQTIRERFEKALEQKFIEDAKIVMQNPEKAIKGLAYWAFCSGLLEAARIADTKESWDCSNFAKELLQAAQEIGEV